MIAASVALMIADYRYHQLNAFRDYLSLVIYPVQWFVDAPSRLSTMAEQYTHSFHQLVQENDQLKNQQLLLSAQVQKYMALEAENERLRSLLQSSPRNGETLLVAEIMRVDSDPMVRRVTLNKGSDHGVIMGQTVIDAEGVIGEVIEVNPLVSRVILLTDTSYGIPVENVRNGVRAIAVGTGAINNLELQHIPSTIDLKTGDSLVTSGLDGRYPPGYPVGVINRIDHDPGESYARVQVTPTAHLERTRQVLLVQRSSVVKPASEVKADMAKNLNKDKADEKEKGLTNKVAEKDKITDKDKVVAKDKATEKVTDKDKVIAKDKAAEPAATNVSETIPQSNTTDPRNTTQGSDVSNPSITGVDNIRDASNATAASNTTDPHNPIDHTNITNINDTNSIGTPNPNHTRDPANLGTDAEKNKSHPKRKRRTQRQMQIEHAEREAQAAREAYAREVEAEERRRDSWNWGGEERGEEAR